MIGLFGAYVGAGEGALKGGGVGGVVHSLATVAIYKCSCFTP